MPDNVATFLQSNVPLFKSLPSDKLTELINGSRVITIEPNEAVVEFGEEGRFLGVLLEGEAEVSYSDDSGERHRVAVLKTSDIFGEISLMTGDRTTADIIGISRCKLLIVPHEVFSTIIATDPPSIRCLSKLISDRARRRGEDETENKLAATAFRRSDDPYGLSLKTDEPMKLLVINCGSSSLKYNLFDTSDERRNVRGLIERIGTDQTVHKCQAPSGDEIVKPLAKGDHTGAFESAIEALLSPEVGAIKAKQEIGAVGHRVVHGGEKFNTATLITDDVLREIEQLSDLAPLHNPVNVAGIAAARKLLPNAKQVAVFDTSFHHTLPSYAYLYGLPMEYYEQRHVRRYGFHGMSHMFVSLKSAQFLKRPFNELEIISCHLGNGASMCAIDHGRSIDTSMGLTPTEGLIMGTRCGDLDPGALAYLMRTEKLSADNVENLINRKSGLLGLSGFSNDMREIEKAALEGNHRALLAFKTFCYRIRKYIGAYCAAMQGLDVVVFTGGIGQGSAGVRSLACQGLAYMGIKIDEEKNQKADGFKQACDISTDDAPVRTLVVPTDEERMIARETIRTLNLQYVSRIIKNQKPFPIPIEISAHHVHLAQEHVEALFGTGHQLTKASDLSQPGQFACKEQVTLVGPKGRVERVRVLGPARKATKIEIAMTEQFKLGIHPPIRESGDIEGTPGITLEGTHGSVTIDKGVICALRHIHMTPDDALRFGLKDKSRVLVRVPSGARELIFGDVVVRVNSTFKLAMHLDTDEGNAANITTGMTGFIDGIQTQG
jgi:acetate kinase